MSKKVNELYSFRLPEDSPLRRRVKKKFTLPSKTQQEFADNVNIHKLLERYARTGQELPKGNSIYGDVSQIRDYQTLQNKKISGMIEFDKLPKKLKERFRSPQEFLNAFQTSEGREELQRLGYLKKKAEAVTPAQPKAPEGASKPSTGGTGGAGGAPAPSGT